MTATILPFPAKHTLIDMMPDCPSLPDMARVLQRHYSDLNPCEQIIARECIKISQQSAATAIVDLCKAMAWARHILMRHELLAQAFHAGDCRLENHENG